MESSAQVFNVTFRRGELVRDDTTTTAVKVLDCRPLFRRDAAGTILEKDIYVRLVCTKDLHAVPLATADGEIPAPAAWPALSEMDFFVAKAPEGFQLEASAPLLAYSADAGVLVVRRSSPPRPTL